MNSKCVLQTLEDETERSHQSRDILYISLVVLVVGFLLIPLSDTNIKVAYQVNTRAHGRLQLHPLHVASLPLKSG